MMESIQLGDASHEPMSMEDIDALLSIACLSTTRIRLIYDMIMSWKNRSIAIGVDADEHDHLMINLLSSSSQVRHSCWIMYHACNDVILSRTVDLSRFDKKIIPIDSNEFVKFIEQLELMCDIEDI